MNELAVFLRAQFFTAKDTQRIREQEVNLLLKALNEVWERRYDRQTLEFNKNFHAIHALADCLAAILADADAAEIHEKLEEALNRTRETEASRSHYQESHTITNQNNEEKS